MRVMILGLGVALLGLAGIQPAQAAPQILGLVATLGPVELQCDDGLCGAEFAALCLQRHRQTPPKDKVYHAHKADDLILHGKTAGGDDVRVAVGNVAEIHAVRGFSAVSIAVPQQVFADHGLVTAGIQVGPNASLIPEDLPGDLYPLTTAEIDYATGMLRRQATAVLAEKQMRTDAVHILARLVNAAPSKGRMSADDRMNHWDRTFGDGAPDGAAATRAKDALGACQQLTEMGRYFKVRNCLESRQDSLMMDINQEYWDSVTPGS